MLNLGLLSKMKSILLKLRQVLALIVLLPKKKRIEYDQNEYFQFQLQYIKFQYIMTKLALFVVGVLQGIFMFLSKNEKQPKQIQLTFGTIRITIPLFIIFILILIENKKINLSEKHQIRTLNAINFFLFLVNTAIACLFIFNFIQGDYDNIQLSNVVTSWVSCNIFIFLSWKSLHLKHRAYIYLCFQIIIIILTIIKYQKNLVSLLQTIIITIFLSLFFLIALWIHESNDIDNFQNHKLIVQEKEKLCLILDLLTEGIILINPETLEIKFLNNFMAKLFDCTNNNATFNELQDKIGELTYIKKKDKNQQYRLTSAIQLLKEKFYFKNMLHQQQNLYKQIQLVFQKTFDQSENADSSLKSNSSFQQEFCQKQYEVSLQFVRNSNSSSENLLLLTFHNITEFITNKILIANTQFQSKMMETFSHEIKTPLNGAIGPLEQQILNYQATQKPINYREILMSFRSLQILHNVLNDIVDFNYILTNQLSFQVQKLNLQVFLQTIIGIVSDLTELKQLKFIYNIDSNLPQFFRTDFQRLQQILLNLISNSLKFTIHGSIQLSINYVNNLNSEIPKNMIKFEIIDTGEGMDKHKQSKIQKLLQNTDLLDNININKTGICLGLSISQILTKQLGPQTASNYQGLFFTSQEELGTQFSFYIQEKKSDTIISSCCVLSSSDKSPKSIQFSPYGFNRINLRNQSMNIPHLSPHLIISFVQLLFLDTKFGKRNYIKEQIAEDEYQSNKKEYMSSGSLTKKQFSQKQFKQNDLQSQFTFSKIDDNQFDQYYEDNNAIEQIDHYQKSQYSASQKKFQNIKQQENFETPQFQKQVQAIQQKQILLVDDDGFNLYTLELLLSKFNFTIEKAYNGKQALELVQCKSNEKGYPSQFYDLIIMDYQMPIMDGIESTTKIRSYFKENNLPQIPIIACSAFEAKSNIYNCINSGMNAYLKKPVTFEMLSNIIKKYLQ